VNGAAQRRCSQQETQHEGASMQANGSHRGTFLSKENSVALLYFIDWRAPSPNIPEGANL
jgi:hypothetical protein